eukprot:TRINITY_DN21223_c0_g1_i1.p1 TRINITY_DN21223_c0_g1~~TRINITY_DN21223_c0_g1_i1.p1  ORF type:complete len:464 (-),score=9.71 TRINITY_DN21223_c0_g1_i1:105-1475(-)
MATISYIFFTVVLVSSVLGSNVHGGGEPASYHVVSVRSLLPSTVCSPSKGFKQRGLRIVYRHGPCSSLAQDDQTLNDILRQDESRVQWLRSKLSTDSQRVQVQETTSIPAHSGSSLGVGNYIVTIGFGTPKKDFSVMFDTGSDLTWIQCKPCVGYCHPQEDPLFDPTLSSSYRNISCNSLECSQLSESRCTASTCVYGVDYGDNSSTVGFFAQETLTLTPTDVFANFKFGCGQKNRGLFGNTTGLVGLGRGQVSLVSQTAQKYNKVFSYCLPPTSSSTGYLAFGPIQNSSAVAYTSLVTNPKASTFYFLDLMGISLEGKTLPIPQSVFSSSGTIIDSGTVITRLPQSAYAALRSAFRQSMSKYPSVPNSGFLDTCYDLSGYDTVDIPTISLLYRGGVSMDLDFTGIVYVYDVSKVCLAFATSEDDLGIIGNVQQRTFEVVYDLAMGRVGFRGGGCS